MLQDTVQEVYLLVTKSPFNTLTCLTLAYLFSQNIPSSELCATFLQPRLRLKYKNSTPIDPENFKIVQALLENSNSETREGFCRLMVLFLTNCQYFQLHEKLSPLERNILIATKHYLMNTNFFVLCSSFADLLCESLFSKIEIVILSEECELLLEVLNEVISAELVSKESVIMKKIKSRFEQIQEFSANTLKNREIKQELAINSSANQITAMSLLPKSLEVSRSKIKNLSPASFVVSEKVLGLIDIAQYML